MISYGLWLMIVILGFSVIQNIGKFLQIKSDIRNEQAKIAKIQEQNQTLEKQLASSQDLSFVEKQVRDKLGLAKPDEAIVVLPDEDTLRKLAPQNSSENNSLPDPNWKRWEKLFF